MANEPEQTNCVGVRLQLCGDAYDAVATFQLEYKKKHKRHISQERAINLLLKEKK